MANTIGERIVEFRQKKGWTQGDLASKLKVSIQVVADWENDIATPSFKDEEALSDVFDVSYADFMNFKKDVNDIAKEDSQGSGFHIGSDGVFISFNGKKKRALQRKTYRNIASLIDSLSLLIVLIIYIALGLVNDQYWATTWPLFIAALIPGGFYRLIVFKNVDFLPVCQIALTVYCFIGSFTDLWHPYWLILLFIPIYYLIIKIIKNLITLNEIKGKNSDKK